MGKFKDLVAIRATGTYTATDSHDDAANDAQTHPDGLDELLDGSAVDWRAVMDTLPRHVVPGTLPASVEFRTEETA